MCGHLEASGTKDYETHAGTKSTRLSQGLVDHSHQTHNYTHSAAVFYCILHVYVYCSLELSININ